MLKIDKKYFIYLLFSPILFNAIINLFTNSVQKITQEFNFYDLVWSVLLFIVLYNSAYLVKKVINLRGLSISFVFFIFSYFIVDISILFFYKDLDFNDVFILVSCIWMACFIFYKKEYFKTSLLVISYFLLNIFTNNYLTRITKNKNIIGDVEVYFYPHAKNIYENSYYFSITNPITEGYPQFTSYIQSLFLRFSLDTTSYEYYAPTSNIIFLLSILFFLELKISANTKFFMIMLFSALIFNSVWFQFLFTSSLMGEGIVSLFTSIVIYDIFTTKKLNPKVLLLLGMLYFTKQFISTFSLFLVLILIIRHKKIKYLIIGFFGILLKEFMFISVFPGIKSSLHLSEIDLIQTIIDILSLNNLKYQNIYLIFKNILIDRPLTLLLICFVLIYFLSLLSNKNIGFEVNVFYLIILFNIIFIFLLYISAWKNMELESPVRFILSFFHLKLISVAILIDNYS